MQPACLTALWCLYFSSLSANFAFRVTPEHGVHFREVDRLFSDDQIYATSEKGLIWLDISIKHKVDAFKACWRHILQRPLKLICKLFSVFDWCGPFGSNSCEHQVSTPNLSQLSSRSPHSGQASLTHWAFGAKSMCLPSLSLLLICMQREWGFNILGLSLPFPSHT